MRYMHIMIIISKLNLCTSVKRFASDVVGPKVREMDEKESMDSSIIKGLFEQGVSYLTASGLRD